MDDVSERLWKWSIDLFWHVVREERGMENDVMLGEWVGREGGVGQEQSG